MTAPTDNAAGPRGHVPSDADQPPERSPVDYIEEIKLYFNTGPATILDDFAKAIDLLKALPDDETRERAAVYMEGLAQMRSEWGGPKGRPARPRAERPPGSPKARRRRER